MRKSTPDRFFVYVSAAQDGEVAVLHLDATTGLLEPHVRAGVQESVMPLALSPDQGLLYAATRGGEKHVHVFAIDTLNGGLTPRAQAPIESSLASLCAEPGGRFLLGASYGEHRLSVYRADDIAVGNGTPLQVVDGIEHAHAVIVSDDGRFAYATALGSDRVFAFALESEGMREIGTVQLDVGFGPRHLRLSPGGDTLYVLSEFRATVAVFNRDNLSGMLEARHVSPRASVFAHLDDGFARPNFSHPVQPDPATLAKLVWAADIHTSPDGRFVYASERTSSRIVVLRAMHDGTLEPISSIETEAQPRGFRLDPTGRFLVACGEKSPLLSVYAIDADNGTLTLVSRCPGGQGANWIEIVAATTARA
jgi:6-phosphogluconolactonase